MLIERNIEWRSCAVASPPSRLFGIALIVMITLAATGLMPTISWAQDSSDTESTETTPGSLTPQTLPEGVPQPPASPTFGAGPAPLVPLPSRTYLGWTILPSLGVTESFTDNARQTVTNRIPDFFTTVSPDLFITGASPRLQGVMNLDPQVVHYMQATDEDQVALNGLVNGTATLVPDLLFFTANAAANDYSRAGNQGIEGPDVVPASQRTEEYAYSLAPYSTFHIGRDVVGQVRYQFSQTLFDGNTGTYLNPYNGQTLPPLSGGIQNEIYAKIQSDPSVGRIQGSFTADGVDFASSDPLLSSRNITTMATGSYLVARSLWLTAGAGYQNLIYPQEPQIDYIGPIWTVGARFSPNPSRVVAISYGESEGRFGFTGTANYALTPIISLFASYHQNVSTMQQDILQNLPDATQLIPGQTIDLTTGLPLTIGNPNLALQNGIFYTTIAAGGAKALYERNTFSLSLNYVNEKSLVPTLAPSQSAEGAILAWSRQLSPKTTSTVSVGYSLLGGAAGLGGSGMSNQLSGSLRFDYHWSATLSLSASYTGWNTTGDAGSNLLINLVTVGVRKVF
jgi:uncharacterized protein (PEP-CTERM system associated)